LVLGFTFKENCPDVRNTRVIDIVSELRGLGCDVDVFDPIADVDDTRRLYGIELVEHPKQGSYDTVILAVAHDAFVQDQAFSPRSYGKDECVVFDVKGALPRETVDGRL
jgi:UDP-N-acetyl-D-galactosamine dehydrogenase